MPHKLVGKAVIYSRPVIIKPGFQRMNDDNEPEDVPAVIKMVDSDALIVGVEPRKDEAGEDLCPMLHLSFLHPEQLHNLGGSGWRDAFDIAYSVRPASHPDIAFAMGDPQHIAYYMNEDADWELRAIRRATEAAKAKADADAKAKADADADAKAKADADAKDADNPPTVTDAPPAAPAGGSPSPSKKNGE